MSQPPDLPQPPTPLEYSAPPKSNAVTVGCLVLSILVAAGVGLLSALAALILFTSSTRAYLGLLMVFCPLVFVYIAVRLKPRGTRVAVAITVIAAATFLLMIGLCALG